tara:strand:- start:253 stop:507 length:255 start_codon:yes stop_codon:yes gene_type:complete
MRNYELVRLIHEELTAGDGKGSFSNPYLNTVIKITKMIERERPEMKECADIQPGWQSQYQASINSITPQVEHMGSQELDETRFE